MEDEASSGVAKSWVVNETKNRIVKIALKNFAAADSGGNRQLSPVQSLYIYVKVYKKQFDLFEKDEWYRKGSLVLTLSEYKSLCTLNGASPPLWAAEIDAKIDSILGFGSTSCCPSTTATGPSSMTPNAANVQSKNSGPAQYPRKRGNVSNNQNAAAQKKAKKTATGKKKTPSYPSSTEIPQTQPSADEQYGYAFSDEDQDEEDEVSEGGERHRDGSDIEVIGENVSNPSSK